MRIVGSIPVLGGNFVSDGNLFTSSTNFHRFFPRLDLDAVSLGALELAEGADLQATQQRLQRLLPEDIEVLSRRRLYERECEFWAERTPTGLVFGAGLVVGMLVGVLLCYQILYTDVSDHRRQFALLRAIGYSRRFVVGLVLMASLLLSLAGCLPGVLASFAFSHLLAALTSIPPGFTAGRAAGVAALTVMMSALAGLLALRKALSASPVEVF